MSGIGAWIWGTSQLDEAIDKATSELLPSGGEDIALNLEICDQIRSKSAPPKDAMRALKRRLNHKNPNVQLLALSLTDTCIKNGGDPFLAEVSSREFVDNLVSILKIPALNHDVKTALLRHIQNWSIALEGKPTMGYVGQVYKTLQNEGYKFPPKDSAAASSAMVDTQTAPEWIDSEVCLRCRTPFSFTNRKHHCRNCGQVFDQACSSKTMALPHFGIAQEVRVCDGCHSKLTKKAESQKVDRGRRHSTPTRHRSARELADAELQRAIELSLQEVNGTSRNRSGYIPSQPNWGYSEPPLVDRSTHPSGGREASLDEDDPDLKAAIEASLREANAPKPSAPIGVETPRAEEPYYSYAGHGYSQSYPPAVSQPPLPKIPTYDLEPLEADTILTFNQTVEQVQAQGGRDLSRYPAVTELYDKASGLRPKLAMSLDDAGRKEEMLSDMHDKLSQAVKLYDQILSQQVSQPRWRTSSIAPTSPGPYQQQSYSAGHAPNGYNQWAPQPQANQMYQPPTSPQLSYATSPPPQPQQQWQPTTYQPAQQHQPEPVSAPAAPPTLQYGQPTYEQYSPSPSIQTPSFTPASIPHSPPSQQQYQPQPPHESVSLARHSSVMQHPSGPQSSHLTRSNTVAASPSSPPVQYQQRQQVYQGPVPPQQQPALPQFPSAPTAVPQPTYGMYASGFEQKEERKEALLIDL